MSYNLQQIVGLFRFEENSYCIKLKANILESMQDQNALLDLLNQHYSIQEDNSCFCCEKSGGCFVLAGVIYLSLEKYLDALREFSYAKSHFRINDDEWNLAIGMQLLGITYELTADGHQAAKEYQSAIDVLQEYLKTYPMDYSIDAPAKALQEQLEFRLANPLPAAVFLGNRQSSGSPAGASPSVISSEYTDYLALFSIPVYETVTAGPNGTLEIHSVDASFTTIHEIEINNQPFELIVVKKSSSVDHQITIQPSGQYGWALVRGESMNGWALPFNPGDYVLFYKTSSASNGDFVIASGRDPSGEITPIVKRYNGRDNLLMSRSKDTSTVYTPIPLDDEHQILGLVIAVAKPK